MKPELQRIAIAEACGWKRHKNPNRIGGWRKPKGVDFSWSELDIPDYPADLNAMHEAEKSLTGEQVVGYTIELNRMRDNFDRDFRDHPTKANYRTWHATAAQRAEAFLRTLNLWDDSK